ncbi:MAG: winged helix-turn-helix domain-containing protein, partial [Candidatus Parvarchaeota archaeon]
NVPLKRIAIVKEIKNLYNSKFTKQDVEILESRRPRWEINVRWAITQLGWKRYIKDVSKNQWVITDEGREYLKSY